MLARGVSMTSCICMTWNIQEWDKSKPAYSYRSASIGLSCDALRAG